MENIFKQNASFSDESKSILSSTIVSPQIAVNPNFLYIQLAGFFHVNDLFYTIRTNLDSFMLIYTVSGNAIFTYEEKEYLLLPNSCILFHCMQPHYYRAAPDSEWNPFWIHFNGNSASAYYDEFIKYGWRPIQIEPESMISTAFQQVIATNLNADIPANLKTSHLLTTILTELILKNIDNGNARNTSALVQKVQRRISETYMSEISIDELAEYVHIDKFYMMKEFKKYMGTTIFEYIIFLRISHAKKLLKYSDKTVAEISAECGMNTVTHFIKLFRTREKITPLSFRKKWKCNEIDSFL